MPVYVRIWQQIVFLKVGCRIRTSTGVMILLQVGLEGRGAGAVLGLVAESCTGAERHIVIVFSHTALTLLHAPEDEGDAAEEQGTTNTADNTTNDLLV